MTTSAIYALIHMIEKQGGLWWARGGTNALVAGLVRLFERLGGTLRLGDPVTAIETRGDRTTGVPTRSGWHAQADAGAATRDLRHRYHDLPPGHRRGPTPSPPPP